MSDIRFFDPRLPQMLQGAIIFAYINAFWGLLGLFGGGTSLISLLWLAGAAGAVGIANHRKWGWALSLVIAIVGLAFQILLLAVWHGSLSMMLNLLFAVFLVALLAHPTSRLYVKRYFR
jgi:hypothetical protein